MICHIQKIILIDYKVMKSNRFTLCDKIVNRISTITSSLIVHGEFEIWEPISLLHWFHIEISKYHSIYGMFVKVIKQGIERGFSSIAARSVN